jgi:hypothetical protein
MMPNARRQVLRGSLVTCEATAHVSTLSIELQKRAAIALDPSKTQEIVSDCQQNIYETTRALGDCISPVRCSRLLL